MSSRPRSDRCTAEFYIRDEASRPDGAGKPRSKRPGDPGSDGPASGGSQDGLAQLRHGADGTPGMQQAKEATSSASEPKEGSDAHRRSRDERGDRGSEVRRGLIVTPLDDGPKSGRRSRRGGATSARTGASSQTGAGPRAPAGSPTAAGARTGAGARAHARARAASKNARARARKPRATSSPSNAPRKPRQDDLDVTSWLAFLETLIDRPEFEGEATLIAGAPLTKTQAAALRRWSSGMRPSLWSADRFLTKLREPCHIDRYFDFCERRELQAWARGFPPPWMTKDRPVCGAWTDEIEDDDPIWRARSDERKRQLVGRRQALLAELEAEGGAIWWNGPARKRQDPGWSGGARGVREGDGSNGDRG